MAGTDFQISMILRAVNEMSPVIRQAQSSINSLQRSITGLNTSSNSGSWFDRAIERSNKFGEAIKKAQEKMDNLIASGKSDILQGSIMMAPIVGVIKSAADVQTTQATLELAGLSKNDVSKLTDQANQIMAKTMFSTSQVLGIDKALAQVGMDYSKINTVQQTATYLAELEGNRNGADPIETAKKFAQMTEQLGISRDANKVNNFADMINRIATVTSADVGTLSESSKYFNMVGQIQGLSASDIMLTQGLAARFGLEGSIGGTHLKDFFQRLNPYTHLGVKGGQPALQAFAQLGWLNGVKTDAKGNIVSFSGDAFHDSKGNLVGADQIFSVLGQSYQNAGNKEKFNALLTRVLGQQGQDIAAAVSQNPQAFSTLKQQMAKVPTIDNGVKTYQQTFNQNLHAFTSNLVADGQQIGNIILPTVTKYLQKLNDAMPGIQKFISTHKGLIKDVIGVWAALAGFKIGKGLFKITFGSAGKEVLSIVGGLNKLYRGGLNAGKGIANAVKYIKDFREFAKISRMLGSGKLGAIKDAFKIMNPKSFKVLSSIGNIGKKIGGKGIDIGKLLGKGSLKAVKSLTKGLGALGPKALQVGKNVLSFGGNLLKLGLQALITGARMAIAWIIGLGPIAWIIAGVIAIVALVVVAWKNNWGHIQEHTKQVVSWIVNKFKEFVSFFKNLPKEMLTIGTNIVQGIWNGICKMGSWLKDKVGKFISDFVPGPIKSVLGIHSPSRVMAEHGKFIVQGLALGMDSNGGIVKGATNRLANHVMGFNARPQVSFAGGSGSGSYHDKRNIVINIYAKNEDEAYSGVKKALNINDKYVASRRKRPKVWEK